MESLTDDNVIQMPSEERHGAYDPHRSHRSLMSNHSQPGGVPLLPGIDQGCQVGLHDFNIPTKLYSKVSFSTHIHISTTLYSKRAYMVLK